MERAAVFVIPASFVSYHFFGRDPWGFGRFRQSRSRSSVGHRNLGRVPENPDPQSLATPRTSPVENSYGQGTRMARGSAARMATVSAKPELSSKVLCKGTARAYVNDVPSRRTFRALHKLAGGTPSPCIDRYCGSSRVERCHCRRCCSSTSS